MRSVRREKDAPPHSVMSNTSSCGWKNSVTSQELAGQFATGTPSVEVSTVLALPCNELGRLVRCPFP